MPISPKDVTGRPLEERAERLAVMYERLDNKLMQSGAELELEGWIQVTIHEADLDLMADVIERYRESGWNCRLRKWRTGIHHLIFRVGASAPGASKLDTSERRVAA